MLQIIQDSNLKELLDLASILKTPYIAFAKDHIYGFTDELGYMRRVKAPEWMVEMPCNIISSDILKVNPIAIEYEYYGFDDKGLVVTTADGEKIFFNSVRPPYLYGVLWREFCSRAISILQPNLNYSDKTIFIEDVKPILEESVGNMKASDGAIPITIDDKIMYIYKGLIPYNKPDKVSCTIYNSRNSFVADFSITKKKNIILNVAIMYRKV